MLDEMFLQIAIGSGLMLVSILSAGISLWMTERAYLRHQTWLVREPHGPKMLILLVAATLWILAVITGSVWLWALAFDLLGVFPTLESSVYFSLVAFTTLGFGDVLLPEGWRLLSGMAAANGFVVFGLVVAVMVEALRLARLGQREAKRRD